MPLEIGQDVWYQPEPQPGRDKLSPLWFGPGHVVSKKGEHSYIVEITPGRKTEAHRSRLREHVDDVYAGKTYGLHYFVGKAPEIAPILKDDEYILEDGGVWDVNLKKDKPEFLLKWEGYETPTWQPLQNLVNSELWEFMQREGYELQLNPKKDKGRSK